MTARSWQYTSCHWDACSNHSVVSDFIQNKNKSKSKSKPEINVGSAQKLKTWKVSQWK